MMFPSHLLYPNYNVICDEIEEDFGDQNTKYNKIVIDSVDCCQELFFAKKKIKSLGRVA